MQKFCYEALQNNMNEYFKELDTHGITSRPSLCNGDSFCEIPVCFRYHITKTCLFKYTENVTSKKKTENFQIKSSDNIHISAENIDCGTR